MKCNDENIKNLLLAYREQALEQTELDRVLTHLEACGECRTDLDLLGLLAEESVPDPGEAFWLAMPERVHRAVQKEKAKKRHFNLALILDRFIMPRWVWTAAAAGVVLLVWVAFLAPLKSPERPPSPGYELSEELMPADPSVADPAHIGELDPDELDTAAVWAGSEFASISHAVEQGMANAVDTDLYEELRQLNAKEVERFSTMIEQWKQEG